MCLLCKDDDRQQADRQTSRQTLTDGQTDRWSAGREANSAGGLIFPLLSSIINGKRPSIRPLFLPLPSFRSLSLARSTSFLNPSLSTDRRADAHSLLLLGHRCFLHHHHPSSCLSSRVLASVPCHSRCISLSPSVHLSTLIRPQHHLIPFASPCMDEDQDPVCLGCHLSIEEGSVVAFGEGLWHVQWQVDPLILIPSVLYCLSCH